MNTVQLACTLIMALRQLSLLVNAHQRRASDVSIACMTTLSEMTNTCAICFKASLSQGL